MEQKITEFCCGTDNILAETLNIEYTRWKRLNDAIIILKISAWVIAFIGALIECIYTMQDEVLWLKVGFCVFGSLFLSALAYGVLILLLKPLFMILRKKQNKINIRLNELEHEYVGQKYEKLNVLKSHTVNDSKDKSGTRLKAYIELDHEIVDCLTRIRELKAEKTRLCEWKWAKASGFMVIAAVLFAIALFLAVAFIVIVGFIIVIDCCLGGLNRNHHYDNYKDYRYNDGQNSFLQRLNDRLFNTDKYIKEEIATLKKEIPSLVIKQRMIANNLQQSEVFINEIEEPEYIEKVKSKVKDPKCTFCHKVKPVSEYVQNNMTIYVCHDCKKTRMDYK